MPSPSSSPPVISYELRVGSNDPVTNIVDLPPSALIAHLQRAVFAANSNKLSDRDYTDLDVYPPGSSIEQLGVTVKPAEAEDSIESLLPGPDVTDRRKRRIIVIARPLPSIAGVQGQHSMPHAVHTSQHMT
jgi:hypothetical protein